MSNNNINSILEKNYNKAIEDLRKALITEANLRNQFSIEFMNNVAHEILFGATEEEAYDTINKRFIKDGTFDNIIGDSGEEATKLQIYAISLNNELKKKITPERYKQVNLKSLRRLESRNEDGSIPQTAFTSMLKKKERLPSPQAACAAVDKKTSGRASTVKNSSKKNSSKSKRTKSTPT